jgi:hypothetical protein
MVPSPAVCAFSASGASKIESNARHRSALVVGTESTRENQFALCVITASSKELTWTVLNSENHSFSVGEDYGHLQPQMSIQE